MVTKEIIKLELDKVPEERLEEIYEVVKLSSRPGTQSNGGSLFSKLKNITLDGPEDFAENIDSCKLLSLSCIR